MAERGIFLDLTRYRFRHVRGDIAVYGTWAGADSDSVEPVLALVPLHGRHYKPCCVALSSAFQYDDPRYLAQVSALFAVNLGFEPSMTVAHRIATAILDHLDHLVHMPPEPTDAVVVGEGEITLDGARTRSVELIEHTPKPFD